MFAVIQLDYILGLKGSALKKEVEKVKINH